MSAREKNAQALQALFKSAALVQRLEDARIAVILPTTPLPQSGQLLATTLADTLGRLWPNVDFSGHDAMTVQAIALAAAQSGGSTGEGVKSGCAGSYDVAIAIACDSPIAAKRTLRVGANGWTAWLGPEASCSTSSNPVGPTFAAALAAAQTFHCIFEQELQDLGASPIFDAAVDVRELFGITDLPDDAPLALGETHVFGVGAVTHGFMWVLERWAGTVSGSFHLVDQDHYGSSNGQRYAGMRSSCLEQLKVEKVATRLVAAHPALQVSPHATDLNSYCAERGYASPIARLIVGLDSAEARRQAALKLPERAINMWTEGVRLGAGMYVPIDRNACLACGYIESRQTPLDEVAEIAGQTGLRPHIVRALLDSGRGLTAADAAELATRWGGISHEQFIGQPLRSVLPALCATGRLQLPGQSELADVPFAFASLFAGIAGFMMLLKELGGIAESHGWTQHTFKPPTTHMRQLLVARNECACCSQFAYLTGGLASNAL
ncbi:ThiF family adenylyltransferase (plasmid) [Ralstonia sp. 25C]|uniref:ThiF family adenylyltransferase n=1 Tax=Ralstonia sp. 25C TaxID=3447363 RepID=UPI003F7543B7